MRGSAARAKEMAEDPESLAKAVARVREKFYAKNVQAVKDSKLSLAEDLAKKAGFVEIYPLSEDLVLAVAGALEEADFKSGSSYIGELKLKHIELDYAIGPSLGRILKKVADALNRGLGPTNKAPEVKISELTFDSMVESRSKMLGLFDSYVVAEAWLLRSDELQFLNCGDKFVKDHHLDNSSDVTLRLPTSKTDQRGNGASRRLSCTCGSRASDTMRCAPCAVRRQLLRVNTKFESPLQKIGEDNRPLFPSVDGGRLSKPQLLKEWEALTACPSLNPTGPSPRRSGAKRYARQGLSLWQIQFLGRWAASTVVQYVGEALEDVTAGWSKASDSSELRLHHTSEEKASSSSTPRAASSSMVDNIGTTGTVAQLSVRIDQMEQF